DKEGKQIGFGGGELSKIYKIDISNLDGRVKNAKFTIASDVKNPLCGPEGASAIYGPQKGATPEMIEILDKNLDHLAKIIKRDLGKDIKDLPGAGAAGGLGAALMAFLGAEFRLGIDLIIELVKLEDKMAESDIVVTGEGMTDYQTLYGKVPLGIARVAKKHNKPVICISGSLGEGYEELYYNGIEALFSIVNRPMSLEEAVKRGEGLLEKITINVFKTYLM
ncbi:glycerate kinase, partial [Tepidanaerobacter syntrophicus]